MADTSTKPASSRKAQPLIKPHAVHELGEVGSQGITRVGQVVFTRLDFDLLPVLTMELLSKSLSTPRRVSAGLERVQHRQGWLLTQKLPPALHELGVAGSQGVTRVELVELTRPNEIQISPCRAGFNTGKMALACRLHQRKILLRENGDCPSNPCLEATTVSPHISLMLPKSLSLRQSPE